MYKNKSDEKLIGEDFIKGIKNYLFNTNKDIDEIVIGVTRIAATRDINYDDSNKIVSDYLKKQLDNLGMLGNDCECLYFDRPEFDGFGLAIAAVSMLDNFEKKKMEDFLPSLSRKLNNERDMEWVEFNISDVFKNL